MKRETIVRAWKDPEFRASLTPEERSSLPDCPAGTAFTELDESALEEAVGGALFAYDVTDGCICSEWTRPTKTTFTSREVLYDSRDFATLDALNLARF
jgi:mersacidin/lichenicidin family type 2 lantibiotic